mgnify:CR=1 FL=1
MPKWTDYTKKTALKDNDELMILDADGKANKRTLMSKVWNYVVDKMTSAVVSKLTTTNKTMIGAINELNSKQQNKDVDYYDGDYTVTPKVEKQELATRQKFLTEDVKIKEIPFFEVSNNEGGQTVFIGKEL